MRDQIECAYCGKVKKEVIFCIGASSKKDWCMVEGTGKMACPDCYDTAMAEGQTAIKNYIDDHNKKVGATS